MWLKRDGTFDLRLRGLVIPNPPGDGTPGPVNTINASLYRAAHLSGTGGPGPSNGNVAAYIAVDGWRS